MCIALKILNIETGNAGGIGIQYFQDTRKYRNTGTIVCWLKMSPLLRSYVHTHTGARALQSTHFRNPSRPHSIAIAFPICFMELYKTYYWRNL